MFETPKALSLVQALKSARETRRVEIGCALLERAPDLFREQFGERPAIIVADGNTFAVVGQTVWEAFRSAGHRCFDSFIFRDPALYAEYSYMMELEAALGQDNAIPIAVGSGTINDLVKLAAHRLHRPYLSVATAASMDGYTAFGASITFNNSKQTFSCPAPAAVLADLNTICAAPSAMNAAGYADLIAKKTAGADWLLADALGLEPIDPLAWDIVQGGLSSALANPAGVRYGEVTAIGQLTEGLMLSGLAMQCAKSSRPASGAEHQFSHLWDMQHHTHRGRAPSHGFKVGIGALAVTALYEWLLEQPLDQLDVEHCCALWAKNAGWEPRISQLFSNPELAKVAWQETCAKSCSPEELRGQLECLRVAWPSLRDRLRGQLLPFGELKQRLQSVGAPAEPEQIGISRAVLRESYWRAFFIRRRFTVLDLAVRAGLLDDALQQIFGSDPNTDGTRYFELIAP